MDSKKAKELFDKMPPHLKEQVLNIDKAMKKIEKNDKYHFPYKNTEKKGEKAKKLKRKNKVIIKNYYFYGLYIKSFLGISTT